MYTFDSLICLNVHILPGLVQQGQELNGVILLDTANRILLSFSLTIISTISPKFKL